MSGVSAPCWDWVCGGSGADWSVGGAVKILQSKGVAFVTYVSELNAQFAKEAMMHQSLDSDEILNVR